MKRHWILGVLWILGCGAGSPAIDSGDSTLESPLTSGDDAADDTAADSDLSDTDLASELIQNAGLADDAEDTEAPETCSDADDAPQTAADVPATVVIGGGGEPWQQPDDGVVVWCHASVPLDCPALEPAPNAGHIIVVRRSSETGEFEADTAGEAGISIDMAGGASAPAPDTAAATVPSSEPGAPGVPLPVDAGGSLPPLPGTCVAIRLGGAGMGVAGGASSDAAPVSGEPVAGSAPLPAGEPSAGGHSLPLPPLPGIPALPPPGGCIGVAFPAPPESYPSEPHPGEPHAGGPIAVPTPPQAGGCVSVVFASNGAAGTSQTGPASVGAVEPDGPGLPFFCADEPPLPGRPRPGATPLPPSAGGGHIEPHQPSDGVPEAGEAADDEVR